MQNDDELNKLLGHVIFSQGGVLPNVRPTPRYEKGWLMEFRRVVQIQAELLPKRTHKKEAEE